MLFFGVLVRICFRLWPGGLVADELAGPGAEAGCAVAAGGDEGGFCGGSVVGDEDVELLEAAR